MLQTALRRAMPWCFVLAAPLAAAGGAAPCLAPQAQVAASPGDRSAAKAQAVDRGFLWRIEREGRVSWLYGAMHYGKADWMVPGPRLREAFSQSDVLALEIELNDEAMAVLLATPAAAAMSRMLTPERRRRLARQVKAACLPAGALSSLRPVMQAATLTLMAARVEGLDAQFGMESVLETATRALGKPVAALETAAQQLQALTGGSEAEEIAYVDSLLDELESGQAHVQAGELAGIWARSDWATLSDYRRWCDCVKTLADENTLRRLLEARNPGMADGIEKLHAKGQRVLAAVGALHMVGPQGLPALLAARGFTVTPVLPAP